MTHSALLRETKDMLNFLPANYLERVYEFVKRVPKVEILTPEEEKELQEIEARMEAGERYSFDEVFG